MHRIALRPSEAAEALGISERTLRKWMRDCELPCVRIDGVVLIPRAGLEGWLRERSDATERTAALATEILEDL